MDEDELSVKEELQDSTVALELCALLELSTELLERTSILLELSAELLELFCEEDNSTAEELSTTDEDKGATAEEDSVTGIAEEDSTASFTDDELATRSEELDIPANELLHSLFRFCELLNKILSLELLCKDEDETIFTKDEVSLTSTATSAEESISAEEVTSSPILA